MASHKLVRQNGMIAGVCGGLGAFFEAPVIYFRVLFALMFLAAGAGLIPYILLWLVMPARKA